VGRGGRRACVGTSSSGGFGARKWCAALHVWWRLAPTTTISSLRQRGMCGKTVKRLHPRYERVTGDVTGLRCQILPPHRPVAWLRAMPLSHHSCDSSEPAPMARQSRVARFHYPRTTNTIQIRRWATTRSTASNTSGVAEKLRQQASPSPEHSHLAQTPHARAY
jgi:hypothetical protein